MYIIRKEFHFSAGHYLNGLPKEHPCSNLHGHNYVVTVEVRSKLLDNIGMVKDYRSLQFIKIFIDSAMDHKPLNDFLLFNPTAENLAKHFYDLFKVELPELFAVEVSETPKTLARYEQD